MSLPQNLHTRGSQIGGGGTQMLRCTHACTSFLKLTPINTFYLLMQNLSKTRVFFCYFIPNLTLNRFELRLVSQIWQKQPLFLKTGIFRSQRFKKRPPFLVFLEKQHFQTLKHETRFTCRTKKRPSFTCFFFCFVLFRHVYIYICEWPPWANWLKGQRICKKIGILGQNLVQNQVDWYIKGSIYLRKLVYVHMSSFGALLNFQC